ncbi:hypothetical protein K466DRAFT_601881 [Polyporus arcularius HHB13444]|uniref:Uncharacterized protein n=1 Tax=Polyporus arcularius HHB13444 TaxID=1314778 RepID=A0A5C3P7N2_9APHY|nr:hypothetical protein K466DRAFT_601881 [Polyporus arcularius HHB13444]
MPSATSASPRPVNTWGPWGEPFSSEPWDVPVLVARGDGVVSIVDNRMPAARSVLQRWTLVVRVPSARSEAGGMQGCSTITVPFPGTRSAARRWKEALPVDVDMFQLRLEHEEALIALHSILAYFGARHCPSDEACLDRQWRNLAQGVTDIMENPAYTADTRIVEIARWGRDYLPDEVFDDPWWKGRLDWYPPSPRSQGPNEADDGHSEFEFGEGLDGLPVPEGTFPSRTSLSSSWATDATDTYVLAGRSL